MSAMAIPPELQCFVACTVTKGVKYLPGAGWKDPGESDEHSHENARNLCGIGDNRRLLEHLRVAQVLRFVNCIKPPCIRSR